MTWPFGDLKPRSTRATIPMRRVYLAGPMRGIPHFNFPAFHAAAKELRARGYKVFSPAERDERLLGSDFAMSNANGDEIEAAKHGFNRRTALAVNLDWICQHADGVVLLPGWENSKGSLAERAAAEALGLEVLLFDEIASEGGA